MSTAMRVAARFLERVSETTHPKLNGIRWRRSQNATTNAEKASAKADRWRGELGEDGKREHREAAEAHRAAAKAWSEVKAVPGAQLLKGGSSTLNELGRKATPADIAAYHAQKAEEHDRKGR